MANLTWTGEEGSPDVIEWAGYTFRKGEAVKVDDEYVIVKATTNRFFKVDGYTKPDDPTPEETVLVYPSATEVSAQHPAAKPGEPIQSQPLTAIPKPIPMVKSKLKGD